MKRRQPTETDAARAFRESRERRVQGAIQILDKIQKERKLSAKVAKKDPGPNSTTPLEGFGYWAELAAPRGTQDRVVVAEAASDNGLDKEAADHAESDSPDDLTSSSEDEEEPAVHDSTRSVSGVDSPALDLLDALEEYLRDGATGESSD